MDWRLAVSIAGGLIIAGLVIGVLGGIARKV